MPCFRRRVVSIQLQTFSVVTLFLVSVNDMIKYLFYNRFDIIEPTTISRLLENEIFHESRILSSCHLNFFAEQKS